MVARPSKRTSLIAGAAALLVVAGGGTAIALASGGSDKKASPAPATSSQPPTVSSSPTVSASATPPVKKAVNPLTGIGAVPVGPVLAVKIDDTENGRPQRGVDKADVVYIEQAEGGLTRTVQVYATNKPVVEAVRSVRASDPELLTQYGPISLVASGGGGDSLTTLYASTVQGVINDRGDPAFNRDDNRPAPYNLTSDLTALSKIVKTAGVKDIGFRFAATDPRVTAAPNGAAIDQVVGRTDIYFSWNAAHGIYERSLSVGGAPLTAADGGLVGAANVIVQFCQVSVNYGDVDVEGNPSQYTHSVGTGKAILFRNGRQLLGKWSRPTPQSPTTFTDAAGKVLYQAPGSTYVLLANA